MKIIAEFEHFQCIEYDDDSNEKKTTTTISTTTTTTISTTTTTTTINDKYKIIVLLDSRTPEKIIHTYKVYNGIRALEQFVKINDIVWWFGASIYTLRLFVNMTTGKAFMPDGDDVNNSSHNFIWTKLNKITDNIISVYGRSWGNPRETNFFDLSKLNEGILEYASFKCFYANEEICNYSIGDDICFIDDHVFDIKNIDNNIYIFMYENIHFTNIIAKFELENL